MNSINYYIILFWGSLLAGETFIFPGLYLALKGNISFFGFFGVVILATVVSDFLWYMLGRFFKIEKIRSWPLINKRQETFNRVLNSFQKNNIKVLILSKFIYGTRIITQIIIGASKIPYWEYFLVNILTVTIWLSLITFSTYIMSEALKTSRVSLANEITLVITITIILITYKWLKITIKRKRLL